MNAFSQAWVFLKALPEQQMFQEGNTRRNVAEGQRYSDDPIIDSSGATSEGTVHPAIYGMLQRYEESQRPGRSTEPLPNLNLRGPRVGGSIASGPDRYGLPDDSVAAEDGPFMGTLGQWPHGRERDPQGDQRRHWRTHPEHGDAALAANDGWMPSPPVDTHNQIYQGNFTRDNVEPSD